MGKLGKISVIPKEYDAGSFATMEKSLREKGLSRAPGTIKMIFPFNEINGKYRTGLDENAKWLDAIEDPIEKEHEKAKIRAQKIYLEDATGLDLSPTSKYYDYSSSERYKVEPYRLIDGDNIFSLTDPFQTITYCWLKSHPTIASSLADYTAGKYPPDTQYFVNNEEVNQTLEYNKRKTANDAIIKFSSWGLEKRRAVARLLDLPIGDETPEEQVYNTVDDFLKTTTILFGTHKGRNAITVFAEYANLDEETLAVKDLIERAMKEQIFKEKQGGRVFEGELEVYKSKYDMVDFLLDDANQDKRLEIERKLKGKKLAKL